MTEIIAGILGAVVALVVIVLVRFNLKRLHVIRCTREAGNQQLEAIYSQIERIGSQQPTCAVLARLNCVTDGNSTWHLPIPAYVQGWGGKAVEADVGIEVKFKLSNSLMPQPVLKGRCYRLVAVPRKLGKSGKIRNQFSPSAYLAQDPNLLESLSLVCAKYPAGLLGYLLAVGAETFEFDSINQARVGGSPAWVQGAEFPVCSVCRKRMSMIVQLPGVLLPGKPSENSTFYFFGCALHQDMVATIEQST